MGGGGKDLGVLRQGGKDIGRVGSIMDLIYGNIRPMDEPRAAAPAPAAPQAGLEDEMMEQLLANQGKGTGMAPRAAYTPPARTPLSSLVNGGRGDHRFGGARSMAPGGRPGGL